jgi:type IX secretion system PorP/SprF family membrane protein
MKISLSHIVLFLFLTQLLYSQENGVVAFDLPVRNSLKFNRYLLNPTFSFVREQNKYVSFTNKREMLGFDNAPSTYLFGYSGRLRENMGIGIGLFQQNYGVLTTFGGVTNFAYNVVVNRDSNLTFGMNVGLYKSGINDGEVITNFPDPSIINIPSHSLLAVNPGINYGIAFLDFGVSFNNLVAYNLTSSKIVEDNPEQSIQGHVMYTGYLNSRGFLDESKFSTLFMSEIKKEKTVLSGIMMLTVPIGIWAQAGYNTRYGVSGGVGINITEQISMEYNYEKTLGDLNAFGSSHEITLAYKFENKYRYIYSGDDDDGALLVSYTKRKRTFPKRKVTTGAKVDREAIAAEKEKLAEAEKLKAEAEAEAEQAKHLAEQQAKQEAEEAAQVKLAEAEKLKAEAEAEQQAKLKAEEAAQAKLAEEGRLKAEAEALQAKLKAEEAAQAKLAEEERLKEEVEQAKVLAEQQAKLKAEEAARAKLAEEERLKEEAEQAKVLAEQQAKLKAEEAAQAKLAEEERLKAEAEQQAKLEAEEAEQTKLAEAERLKAAAEQNIDTLELDGVLVPTARDREALAMKSLADLTDSSKIEQQDLLIQLKEKIASKQKDLDDLKEENDLSEQGIRTAPKAFKSVSAENAELKALQEELDEVIESQNTKISELEELYDERLKTVNNKNDQTNIYYSRKIEQLKNEQFQTIQSKETLYDNLEDIKVATEIERKRRIKRAAYDNQEDRYLKDRAALQQIKQSTQVSSETLTESDFDFGEERSNNISIVKNIQNTESGYYLVLAVHSDVEKRDEFLRKAIMAGRTDIDFFFDVNTNKYYIYYKKFDDIESANREMQSNGDEPYNSKLSTVKIEN